MEQKDDEWIVLCQQGEKGVEPRRKNDRRVPELSGAIETYYGRKLLQRPRLLEAASQRVSFIHQFQLPRDRLTFSHRSHNVNSEKYNVVRDRCRILADTRG